MIDSPDLLRRQLDRVSAPLAGEVFIFIALDSIADATPPIRFPESDVFVLQPEDPEPFRTLHEAIRHCGVPFEPSPFDFVPHCTLSQKPQPTPEEAEALLATKIRGEFLASTLSLYEMEVFPLVKLRWRGYLT